MAEEAATTTEDGFAMFKQILVEESDELVCSERRVNYTWTKTKSSKLFLKNLKNLKNWWKKFMEWHYELERVQNGVFHTAAMATKEEAMR